MECSCQWGTDTCPAQASSSQHGGLNYGVVKMVHCRKYMSPKNVIESVLLMSVNTSADALAGPQEMTELDRTGT